jgi:hypothetical protein
MFISFDQFSNHCKESIKKLNFDQFHNHCIQPILKILTDIWPFRQPNRAKFQKASKIVGLIIWGARVFRKNIFIDYFCIHHQYPVTWGRKKQKMSPTLREFEVASFRNFTSEHKTAHCKSNFQAFLMKQKIFRM